MYVYLFLAVLGLHRCIGLPLVVASGGYSLVGVLRLLTMVVSLVAEHRLWGTGTSVLVAHRLGGFSSQAQFCGSWA